MVRKVKLGKVINDIRNENALSKRFAGTHVERHEQERNHCIY